MSALEDIATERLRQITAEGRTPAHDDEHTDGAMAKAAAAYAATAGAFSAVRFDVSAEAYRKAEPPRDWPWDREWWKPKDPRRDLVRAAALIVAEIERLDRAAAGPLAPLLSR